MIFEAHKDGCTMADPCPSCVNYGASIECSRIIDLLEKQKCPCYCEVHPVLDAAIALIKGENK